MSRRGRGTSHGISRSMGDVSRPLYTSLASELLEDEAVMIGRVVVGAMSGSNYSSMVDVSFYFVAVGRRGPRDRRIDAWQMPALGTLDLRNDVPVTND